MIVEKEGEIHLVLREEEEFLEMDILNLIEEVVEEEVDLAVIEDQKVEGVEEESLEEKILLKVDLTIIKEVEIEREEVNSFSSQIQNLSDKTAQNKIHLPHHYLNTFSKIFEPYPLQKEKYLLQKRHLVI